MTVDGKSDGTDGRSGLTIKDNTSQSRIYSTPVPTRNNKHELSDISPYAQFAVGFRTFGHVDNQDVPTSHRKHRYNSETSFQVCSECDDTDTLSKYTLKGRSKCARGTSSAYR
ncbi:uncharacterized protein LOC126973116 [Leptidea sinapis]|uniref:uncharacterized protein LOC126973116 n=1 Tax=Leptidea sinapis TaxID=189913 RepID=UPI0021322496|nr:uncharacterized protein LOC126973116 [Leptidea sinapis]